MFFILKLIKGWQTRKALKAYKKYKAESLKLQEEGGSVETAEKSRWKRFREKVTPRCLEEVRKGKEWIQFKKRLTTYGTIENYYAKSMAGFLSGVIIMYVIFLFFVFPLAMPLTKATAISIILGVPCMVLLAFNEATRCVVLMLIPHLFSSKGRQALATYAIVLAFSEPGRNAIRNVQVMTDSLACGQEKANQLLKNVVALIKEPFVQIKQTMNNVLSRIKQVLKKMKTTVDTIKRVMSSIIGVIQTAFDWLNNVVGLCSKKLGTPFQRCTRAFDNAIDDCNAKLGSWFNWMCSVVYVTKTVCFTVKFIDYICAMFEFVSDEIIIKAKRRLKEFVYHVRNLFYVSIDFSHTSSYQMEKSQDVSDVLLSIATDMKKLVAEMFGWLDGASFVLSLFMFYCIYSAYRYRKKFLTREWYDNYFLTRDLIEIEIQRTKMDKETIFPLSRWEKMKYVQLTSLKLVGTEKIKMMTLLVLMAWLFAKIGFIVSSDWSIWWLVNKVKNYANLNMNIEGISPIEVNVSDSGVMHDVYKGIVDSFQPQGLHTDIDTSNCAPNPGNPTYFAYKQLAILALFIFIMTLFQPYGQRLRVVIMRYYYPGVARRRAVWLYNNILRSRGTFLKYARRQLRRQFAHDTDIEAVSVRDRIFAVCPCLRLFFPRVKFEACLLCGTPSTPNEPLFRCQTPNCVGLYCAPCFNTLQNVCTICKSPIDYGDLTDLSEERDSSDYFDQLEREIFGQNTVLDSDVNISEGYETDYDESYQKEKRDPTDVPIVPTDLDSVESQRLSTDLAEDDVFDLSPEQRLKDSEFRDSLDMTLRKRIGSSFLRTVSVEPTPSVRGSSQSRAPSLLSASTPRTGSTQVTSISETDGSSSRSTRFTASTAGTDEIPPKCFLFRFCRGKKSAAKKIKSSVEPRGATSSAGSSSSVKFKSLASRKSSPKNPPRESKLSKWARSLLHENQPSTAKYKRVSSTSNCTTSSDASGSTCSGSESEEAPTASSYFNRTSSSRTRRPR